MTFKQAMDQVKQGHRFDDPEILKLKGSFGFYIAHLQAAKGFFTEDPEILGLKAEQWGTTVGALQLAEGWEPQTPESKVFVVTCNLLNQPNKYHVYKGTMLRFILGLEDGINWSDHELEES